MSTTVVNTKKETILERHEHLKSLALASHVSDDFMLRYVRLSS